MINFVSTVKGSLLEGFYPEGWDFDRIAECCSHAPEEVTERQDFWNPGFAPVSCATVADFDVKMGHEIANRIRTAEKPRSFFLSAPWECTNGQSISSVNGT